MAFEKGQSGNPGGRPKEKLFTDAVRIAVNREADDGRKKLTLLADKLVDFAMAGEGWAMQQIADRLEGKPAQSLDIEQMTTHEVGPSVAALMEAIDGRTRSK